MSIKVSGARFERDEIVLNEFSLALIEKLHIELNPRRKELLKKRQERILDIANGNELDFLAETKKIREDNSWKVAPLAPGLIDRRVEITGPTERKMTINALNSGAKVWLADQEDSTTPNWENVVQSQINLNDAISNGVTGPVIRSVGVKKDIRFLKSETYSHY